MHRSGSWSSLAGSADKYERRTSSVSRAASAVSAVSVSPEPPSRRSLLMRSVSSRRAAPPATYTLSMGHRIQVLTYNAFENRVDVRAYRSRFGSNADPTNRFDYAYGLWCPESGEFAEKSQTFLKYTPRPRRTLPSFRGRSASRGRGLASVRNFLHGGTPRQVPGARDELERARPGAERLPRARGDAHVRQVTARAARGRPAARGRTRRRRRRRVRCSLREVRRLPQRADARRRGGRPAPRGVGGEGWARRAAAAVAIGPRQRRRLARRVALVGMRFGRLARSVLPRRAPLAAVLGARRGRLCGVAVAARQAAAADAAAGARPASSRRRTSGGTGRTLFWVAAPPRPGLWRSPPAAPGLWRLAPRGAAATRRDRRRRSRSIRCG